MVKYLCCNCEWCCSFCRYCLCSRLPFYECSNSGHRIYREGSLAFLHGPMSVSFSDVVYNYSGYNDYDDDYYFIFCYYEGKPTLDLQGESIIAVNGHPLGAEATGCKVQYHKQSTSL